MPAVADLERLLERLFERTSARLFHSRVQTVQLERRVERAMEAGRTGRGASTAVPNRYRVRLHPADLDDLAARSGGPEVLAAVLADRALAFARLHGYHLAARPIVGVVADPSAERGSVEVDASVWRPSGRAGDPGAAASLASLVTAPPAGVPSAPTAPPAGAPSSAPAGDAPSPPSAPPVMVPLASDGLAGLVAPGPAIPVAEAPARVGRPAAEAIEGGEPLLPATAGGPAAPLGATPSPVTAQRSPAGDLAPAPASSASAAGPRSGSIRSSGEGPHAIRPAAPAPVRALLRVSEPGGREREVRVDGGPLTLGRATDNTLVLADSRVSRHHGRFVERHGTLVYTDLGSTNGTRVNGIRVDEIVLGAGDRIQVGDVVLVVEQLPR